PYPTVTAAVCQAQVPAQGELNSYFRAGRPDIFFLFPFADLAANSLQAGLPVTCLPTETEVEPGGEGVQVKALEPVFFQGRLIGGRLRLVEGLQPVKTQKEAPIGNSRCHSC